MTRDEIHKLPWEAQEYINNLERKLALFSVSKSVAKEWGEFIIRCEREGMPLLLLDDYIEQYCC